MKFLAQGTLYPDVIESTSVRGPSAVIKSHHNVGGLPKKLGFKLVEPLRELFKDEVRAVGQRLGLDEEFVHRQPFPGPGLAVRHLGAITKEGLDLLREADAVVRDILADYDAEKRIWQCPVVLLPLARHGEWTIAIRPVESHDGMTAQYARLPLEILERTARTLFNVQGIGALIYDVTNKPPGTIEWE